MQHTFRHTDRLGIERSAVASAVRRDLARQEPLMPGTIITGTVTVGEVTLEYRAFALADANINVGRITGI